MEELEPFYATPAEVPEAVRGFYQEKEGKAFLRVTSRDGWGLEDTTALRSALQSERKAASTHAKALKAFEGLDAAAAREALTKVEEMKNWTPEERVREQIAAREKALGDKFSGEIAKRDADGAAVVSQLRGTLTAATAASAVSKHKGNLALLLPHIERTTRMMKGEDGKYSLVVVDDKGEPRLTMRPNSTDSMTLDELVESWTKDENLMAAFEGSGHTGTGGRTATGGRGRGGGASHRISAADAENFSAYQAAKKAAEAAGVPLEIVG